MEAAAECPSTCNLVVRMLLVLLVNPPPERIWPSNPPLDFFAMGNAVEPKFWCTTSTLELMATMLGASSVIIFMMRSTHNSVSVTDLHLRDQLGHHAPAIFVDVGAERSQFERIMPHNPKNANAMYVAMVGDHFQLMVPKRDVQTLEALCAMEDQIDGFSSPQPSPQPSFSPSADVSTSASKRRKVQVQSVPQVESKSNPTLSQDEASNGRKCCVCLEKNVATVFVPCGHALMCLECASLENLDRLQHRCPACRQEFHTNIPIFWG